MKITIKCKECGQVLVPEQIIKEDVFSLENMVMQVKAPRCEACFAKHVAKEVKDYMDADSMQGMGG